MTVEHDELALAAPYALGALDDDERRLFEAHLPACDECQRELQSMQRVTMALASGVAPRTPPLELRERVLGTAAGTRDSRSGITIVAPPQRPRPEASPNEPVRERRLEPASGGAGSHRRRASIPAYAIWLPVAALIAVAVGLGVYANGLQGRIAALEARLDQAIARAEVAERSTSEVQQVAVRAQSAMGVLVSPDMARIDLTGQPAAPVARARAFWSRDRGLVFTATNLPPLPPGRVYQIWVLTAGTPISAGLVMPDGSGTATVVVQTPQDIPPPAGVAVTDEPAGGVASPTGSMYLKGAPVIS